MLYWRLREERVDRLVDEKRACNQRACALASVVSKPLVELDTGHSFLWRLIHFFGNIMFATNGPAPWPLSGGVLPVENGRLGEVLMPVVDGMHTER